MERLTVKQVVQNERECVARQQCDRNCAKCDLVMDAKDILSAYDHVLGLLDAEESGLLVRLPCKVGDMVWVIITSYTYGEVGDRPEAWHRIDKREFKISMLNDFDKTVFLSREKAEAALKELSK